MSILLTLYIVAALVITLLTLTAVRNAAPLMQKAGALSLATIMLAVAYTAMAELMSRSKPVALEWWENTAGEADVLAGHIAEGDGIHLWLMLEGDVEPRAFVMPWDRDLAEALQEALEQAERDGTGVRMRLPFEQSFDNREERFYALPQPAAPPKDGPSGPEIYEQPGQAA